MFVIFVMCCVLIFFHSMTAIFAFILSEVSPSRWRKGDGITCSARRKRSGVSNACRMYKEGVHFFGILFLHFYEMSS